MEREIEYYRGESRGWGVAALVVALAVVCAVGAGWIHMKTYMHPTHPLNPNGGVHVEPARGDVAGPH